MNATSFRCRPCPSHPGQQREGVAFLFAIHSGRRADEIILIDAQNVFRRLGLGEHLTSQRPNGFAAMVARIRADARCAMQEETKVV